MEKQARKAFEQRNKYRAEARYLMTDREKAAQLDIEEPNKTFEELLEHKAKKYGLTG
ncbi:MAG: hypothetical protein ACOYIT_03190 [Christensenellales bacterium]